MPSDDFTNVTGTAITSHNPGAWAQIASVPTGYLTIYNNMCKGIISGIGGARYVASTADLSQARLVACSAQPPAASISKRVAVRTGAATRGYEIHLQTLSGNNYTRLAMFKNAAFLAYISTTLSVPSGVDHILRLEATGTNPVLLTCYLDGVQIGSTYSDSASPIGPGNPGFLIQGGAVADDNCIDDWTDGVSSGFAGVSRGRQLAGISRGRLT